MHSVILSISYFTDEPEEVNGKEEATLETLGY